MKNTLNKLYEDKKLTTKEAEKAVTEIAEGKYNTSQIASFLTVFRMRPVTVEELTGFRNALYNLCLKVDFSDFNTIDLCGTGGDNKNTFNISTLSSFIVAGARIKVAKHGNYSVSSNCGSSNVLEHFGYKFTNDERILKRQLEDANICYMHAPLFHPAMKNVAPVRKEMGVKTFFNILGPLVNPSNPQNQLVGVYNLETARLYDYFFQNSNIKYSIVYSFDGYDEISLTGEFKVISRGGDSVFSPEDINLKKYSERDLYGGETVEEAAQIFKSILEGQGTEAQNNVVLTNAAFAIKCVTEKTFEDCFETATESLLSKNALNSLKQVLGQG